MTVIQAFDENSNPIAHIIEDITLLLAFLKERALMYLAEPVWRVTSKEDRLKMLKHLWANIQDGDEVLRPKRFHEIREMIRDGYDEQGFLALAEEDDFDGEVPLILHPYIALYVDERGGVRNAKFSSEAFYRNYLESQER